MTCFLMITAVDQSGWSHAFLLEKALVTIGSAPENDVFLPASHGSEVLPEHLQITAMEDPAANSAYPSQSTPIESFHLFNRNIHRDKPAVKISRATGEIIELAGGEAANLQHGDTLKLGEYTLTLSTGISIIQHTPNMGVKLELPSRRLHASMCLTGRLTVYNYHPAERYQVKVQLDGLPDACYQIEPTPLLPPGCDACLLIHFFHNQTVPAAGKCPITLRVTAPRNFPKEEILLKETLMVDPVYAHHLFIKETGPESEA